MPEARLIEFERHLLGSGVLARHARRATRELREHIEDIRDDALAHGLTSSDAAVLARKKIGDLEFIAADIISRTELKTWTWRYPKSARILLPLAYVALLPTLPLFAGVARAQSIARWCTCLMLSALVTAALFLAMQLSIVVT